MPDSEISAQQQEEAHSRAGRCQQAFALVVGGYYAARLGLGNAGDGAGDAFWRALGVLAPVEEALRRLAVVSACVLRFALPEGRDFGDRRDWELADLLAADLGDDGFERCGGVRVFRVRLLELRRGSRDCAGRCLGFAVARIAC
jgi:hypothetical protein